MKEYDKKKNRLRNMKFHKKKFFAFPSFFLLYSFVYISDFGTNFHKKSKLVFLNVYSNIKLINSLGLLPHLSLTYGKIFPPG